jgi:hypothetical protein
MVFGPSVLLFAGIEVSLGRIVLAIITLDVPVRILFIYTRSGVRS